MKYENKIMALIEVLRSRLSRNREKRRDLEILVNRGEATSGQKHHYVELKAREEELETVIDLAIGLIDNDKN